MAQKPRVAIFDFTGCEGCELNQLNFEDQLLDILAHVDIVEWRDALEAACEQGAFIFWNHPGWTGQQPDGVARWYPEHGALVERDQLHGIKIDSDRYKEIETDLASGLSAECTATATVSP